MTRYLLALAAFVTFICVLVKALAYMDSRMAPPVVAAPYVTVQAPHRVGDVVTLRALPDTRTATPVTASSTGELTIHRAVTDDTRLCAEGFGCFTVGELRQAVK